MPSLKDQLAAIAARQPFPSGPESQSSARRAVVSEAPKDVVRNRPLNPGNLSMAPVMGDLPSMVSRLAVVEASIADIGAQLEMDSSDSGDSQTWRKRAERARAGFEKEASGLRAAIRCVQELTGASDKARADSAEDRCRQLAAEVERLNDMAKAQAARARNEDAFAETFVEMSRAILSEAAFQRIKARTEEFMARNKGGRR